MLTVRIADASEVIPLRAAVLRPGRPVGDAVWVSDTLNDTKHWVAEQHDRIIGVATVVRAPFPDGDGPEWQLRGMAVDSECRSTGVGRQLLAQVMTDIDAPMWCNARIGAVAFYQRQGWRVASAEFEVPTIGIHVRMVRP